MDFGVASCLKHYLGYGAVQGGKDYAYVDLTERSIREFHLPPFAAGVAAGAPSVMPAFTTGPGGVPMSANRRMLQDVLRGELGFQGVLVSDYAGITEMRYHGTAADDLEAAVQALRDGTMTVDMEDGVYYAQLARAVAAGRLRVDEIDREVLRALAFKRRLGLFETPVRSGRSGKTRAPVDRASRRGTRDRAQVHRAAQERRATAAADRQAHPRDRPARRFARRPARAMARARPRGRRRERARRHSRARRVGKAGDQHQLLPKASGSTRRASPCRRTSARIAASVAAAKNADLIVAVVGERESMSGEAKNRAYLDLPGKQQALIDALLATKKPVVVVLITGRALAVPALAEKSGALLHAFFPGIEGGHALADVLFGDYNPGGKQPMTWPRSVGQLPIHHYDPPNGRPNIPERGDYKAHWLDEPDEPLFAFGFGLSYSSFTLTALELPRASRRDDSLTVRARLTKLRSRAGDEVPQLYVRPRVASAVTGKRLLAYRRVHLKAGESRDRRIQAADKAARGPRFAESLDDRARQSTKSRWARAHRAASPALSSSPVSDAAMRAVADA